MNCIIKKNVIIESNCTIGPNVTIDAAALCIKSSNSAILRPGSESYQSCLALFNCINDLIGKKTLIMVSHNEDLSKRADKVLRLKFIKNFFK